MRYLTNVPGLTLLLLLVLVPILRWPALEGLIYHSEESLHYVVAERVMENDHLYEDAWYAGPPFMIWLYEGLYALLGAHTLIAVHILTCLFIYITATYFAGWIAQFKPFTQFPGLPAIFFVLLTAIPWYQQQLSSNLLIILPVLLAFQALLQALDARQGRFGTMILIGIYLMTAILINYRAIFLFTSVMGAYLLLGAVRLDELFSMLGGMFIVVFGMVFILFIQGNLGAYWDVGLLYYLDRTGLTGKGVYDYGVPFTLKILALSWGGFLVVALLGFVHFRLRFFSQLAKIRSLEVCMASWMIGVILLMASKWSRLAWPDFWLAVPPLSFYMTKVFEFRWRKIFRWGLLGLCLAIPAYQYWHYLWYRGAEAHTLTTLPPTMIGKQWPAQAQASGIARVLSQQQIQNGIWIMAYDPALYPLLGYPCANKYIDFRMAYYKIESLPGHATAQLMADTEADRDIYLQFSEEPPDVILDPQDFFPLLLKRYPRLLAPYQGIFTERAKIYTLTDLKSLRTANFPLEK